MLSYLATGHPAIPTGDFDFTPLLYSALLLLGLRKARIPLKIWVLPILIVCGGLIDSISDALGLSTFTTASALVLLVVAVSLRRIPARPPRPPVV